MSHWFDQFSKDIGSVELSRRGIAKVSMAALIRAGLPIPASLLPSAAQAATACRLMHGRGAIDVSVGVDDADNRGRPLRLAQRTSVDLANVILDRTPRGWVKTLTKLELSLSGRTAVSFYKDSTVDLATRANIITKITLKYGVPVRGVTNIEFEIRGKEVSGSVDGRRLVPYNIDNEPRFDDLRFTDGRPAPRVRIDPILSASMPRFLDRAKSLFDGCRPEGTQHGSVLSRRKLAWLDDSPDSRSPESRSLRLQLADIGSAQRAACDSCIDAATRTLGFCEAAAALATLVTFGATAAALAACGLAYAAQSGYCWYSPSDCCPVFCHQGDITRPGEGCCDSGESCVDPQDPASRGGCCPTERTCNGKCCPSDAVCTDNAVCCNPGVVSCNGLCCSPNSVCADRCCPSSAPICNGVCCEGGTCDASGNCCRSDSSVCGGTCCPQVRACCNGTCCEDGATCIGGSCCPGNRSCGSTCCPEGQQCDQARGICVDLRCASDQAICRALNADGTTTPICCSPGSSCCAGQCCPPGNVCCIPITGDRPFGCYPQSDCLR